MLGRTSTWPVLEPVQRNGPATGSVMPNMPTSRRMNATAVATASAVPGGRVTGPRGAGAGDGAGDGDGVGVGDKVVGAALGSAAGGVAWRLPQPVRATAATTRAMTVARTGRMVLTPLWTPLSSAGVPRPNCRGSRSRIPIGGVS